MRLLDFLLAPAAALMARLGFSGKFLLLGGLLAAMAVALVAQVALDADRRLDRALAQVAGVEYLKALRRVIDPVQQHRGLSQAAARGDAAAREKLAGRRDAVEAAIAAVDALEARLAGSLGTRASWERAKGAWAALRAQAPGLAAADSFRRHTEVVEVLIEHLDHVADGSGVALTTSAEIFHLADALAFKLPAATEMAGRLRGRGSGAVATGRLAEGEGALLLALAAGARDPLEQMRKSLDDYGDTQGADRDRVRAALDAGIGALADVEKEIAWMAEKGAPRLDAQAYFQLATRPIDTGNALADDLGARLEAQVRREAAGLAARRNATVLACALALVVAALLFAATYRSLRAAVGAVREAARALAAGDLTATARVAGRDELAEVAASFNDVAASFRGVVERITREAGTVASTAQDLSAASSQVATATSQQSEAAASMAASVEQMTVSIDHLRQHSGEVLKVSQHAGELSQEGSASVGAAAAEMAAIAEGARSLAGVIDRLGTESAQISRIVQVIGEIASQTNLLALNAAIEAARAGEQGRGFSVVADEVRKLAERTTQSTREIARMVEAIQGGTGEAVAFVRRWSEKVGDGERRAQEAGGAMREVEADATRAAAAVTEIAGALAEQSSASSQIAQNVERIAQMSEENNAAVGAMADNAQRLDGLAGQLMALVGRFRLQGAPVPAAGD